MKLPTSVSDERKMTIIFMPLICAKFHARCTWLAVKISNCKNVVTRFATKRIRFAINSCRSE